MQRSKALIAAAVLLLASACTKSPPELSVTDAWLRPLLDNGAAFMIINNTGGRTDFLLSVECSCATSISLHETRMEGDIMRMSPVDKLEIPGYAKTELTPTGSHIMLGGVDRNIESGSYVTFLLHFERSGDIEARAEVRKL